MCPQKQAPVDSAITILVIFPVVHSLITSKCRVSRYMCIYTYGDAKYGYKLSYKKALSTRGLGFRV